MSIESVRYRMLTPLIRLDLETRSSFHYDINENIRIVAKDSQVFHNFNIVNLDNFTTQHFSGMSSMVFMYNPLMVTLFPYREDYPDHAEQVLTKFLDILALFKTTLKTKLKEGPRIVQTITAQNQIQWLNIRGSDDFHDFSGKPYYLTLNELDIFRSVYNLLNPILESIDNNTILSAIDFYSRASRHIDITEKFIFLSLALEALFSNEKDELIFRFSNRIALLLGDSLEERQRVSASLRKVIYKKRSSIIHGSNVTAPSDDEYMFLNELIRVSILRFISLYQNGIKDVLSQLDSFLLKQDPSEYNEFKQQSTSLDDNLKDCVCQLRFFSIRNNPSK